MQINDIINKNWSLATRLKIARKLRGCSKIMKREIANWKRTGNVSDRRLFIMLNGQEKMTISIGDLINTYGMEPLPAMLFFDDLIKANINSDKSDLINLLDRLKAGQRKKHLRLTPDMLAGIKKNQPELWGEYQKICQAREAEMANAEEACEQIGETDLEPEEDD